MPAFQLLKLCFFFFRNYQTTYVCLSSEGDLNNSSFYIKKNETCLIYCGSGFVLFETLASVIATSKETLKTIPDDLLPRHTDKIIAVTCRNRMLQVKRTKDLIFFGSELECNKNYYFANLFLLSSNWKVITNRFTKED